MLKSLISVASQVPVIGSRSIMTTSKAAAGAAEELCDFINASPTPYHAVASAKRLLSDAGFVQLSERDSWAGKLEPGGRYFVTRNNSSIVALALERNWRPGSAVAAVGAHTDSPCLKVKPVSKRTAEGYLQVAVETYGGGIWHTWFDRDLSVAGRVIVQSKDGAQTHQRFVHIKKPILRVPTLAIHLDRTANEAFKFNKETQLVPILGLVSSQLNGNSSKPSTRPDAATEIGESAEKTTSMPRAADRHHAGLVDLIATELSLGEGEEVRDFELSLYDTQPSRVGGLSDEFVFSARLDNLGCTFTSIKGLIKSLDARSLTSAGSTARVVACFDHEEIGSVSQQGADSNFLPQVLARINKTSALASSASYDTTNPPTSESLFEESLAKSFLVSADMAHAVNPNYAAHYEDRHRPQMNAGVVVKINQNQRYATNSVGVAVMQRVAELDLASLSQESSGAAAANATATDGADDATKVAKTAEGAVSPLQLFVVRQDHPCGSTIGPMLSAQLGVRTCDVGLAQLDMHSCREVCGAHDVALGIDFFAKFLAGYDGVWQTIELD